MRAKSSFLPVDEPSQDPKSRLKQLQVITAAYKSVNSTEPTLPLPDSPLPALLALRSTLNNIDQTKISIKETHESLIRARRQLRYEEDELQNAREITQALKRKIEKLRIEHDELAQKRLSERAEAIMLEHQQAEQYYSDEMQKLVKAFNTFVEDDLAAMVAAEDLGGPVVGDLIDLDLDVLKTGFTPQGRPKGGTVTEVGRRRRNNQIWGIGTSGSDQGPKWEKDAASADFRSLTEDLLNAAVGEEGSGPYISIRRESAAVRFLVRAKVAQFHPEDARRLRLVDFGSELEN